VTPGPWVAAAAHAVLTALMPALDWLAQLPGGAWRQHAPRRGLRCWRSSARHGCLRRAACPPASRAAPVRAAVFGASGRSRGRRDPHHLSRRRAGLAALVRTRGHALLYDAGPAYSVDADAGNRVVVPFCAGKASIASMR